MVDKGPSGFEQVTGEIRKEEVKVDQTGDVDVKTRGTGKGTTPSDPSRCVM